MKINKTSFALGICILFFALSMSCKKDKDINDDNNNIDTTGTDFTHQSWFFDFNGTIDGGEGYDVIKSSIDGKIYVCGAFLCVNSNWDMKCLARWVPSTNTWEVVPGIDSYHSNFIRCVTEDDNGNLYFGGDFSSIGGVTAGRVGMFNVASGTWDSLYDASFIDSTQQYGPISGGVYSIQYMDNYIYIGGGIFNSDSAGLKYIRRFDLTTRKWEAVGSGVNGRVRCMTTDGNGNLYVGGEFTEAGGIPANYIAKWNGSSWEALGDGPDDYILALEYNNGNLYAGGSFINVGGTISQGIAKWNGSAWEAMSKGVYSFEGYSYSVQAIATDSAGLVYIGGFFDRRYSDNATLNHVGVFSNNEWQQLGDGLATTSTQGVMGMYADGNDIYFVGYFSKGTGDPNDKYNIAIWRK
jgi:trimeric autotransporter adhesin